MTFMPQMVSKEIRGVKSVVDSFNRRLNVRPKADGALGSSRYARRGSRELNSSRLSPEALRRTEKLKEKNDLAVLDYIERVKRAQEMKDYKDEIVDFLSSRHRNAEHSRRRGAQTARDGGNELYQTLTERRMRPISTSRPRNSSNTKSLNKSMSNTMMLSKRLPLVNQNRDLAASKASTSREKLKNPRSLTAKKAKKGKTDGKKKKKQKKADLSLTQTNRQKYLTSSVMKPEEKKKKSASKLNRGKSMK